MLAGALLATAEPARAGEVKLSFSNGLVTVVATDASPREILGEWARLGQVRVTNLDRLAGSLVTLQLTDVSEIRALETILRGTAGYIAAPRREPSATISRYDRILLMPGVAPAMAPAASSPQPPSAGMGRGRPGQPPFGAFGGGGAGPAGDTPGYPASLGVNVTRPEPNRPVTGSGVHQSYETAQPGTIDATQQAGPLPTSSQVPGVPVGPAGQVIGSARPGEATTKPAGQRPGTVGPIKSPE